MKNQKLEQEPSAKQKEAETILRRMIRARRREDGFERAIPLYCWDVPSVRKALQAAAEYLAEQSCEAEREALVTDPRPEDLDFEAVIQSIEKALNGLMSFGTSTNEPEHSPARLTIGVPADDSTVRQGIYTESATAYLHWILDGDSRIVDFRKGLPAALTERAMIDILLSPLNQVLGIEDYQILGLDPWTTRGRITGEEVVSEEAETEGPVRGSRLSQKKEKTRNIFVEVDLPQGGQLAFCVQRQGERREYEYRVHGLQRWWDTVSPLASASTVEGIWEEFRESRPVEREAYPGFPHVVLSYEENSITWEAVYLCRYMVEYEFYQDTNAALRFLMLGIPSLLMGFRYTMESIFVNRTGEFLTGEYRLNVPAWSLPEEIADYWRQIRPPTARERRLPAQDHIVMFNFVVSHTPPGTEPRWAALARLWKEEHGTPLTRDRLYQIFHRVRSALFPPLGYRPGRFVQVNTTLDEEEIQALTPDGAPAPEPDPDPDKNGVFLYFES